MQTDCQRFGVKNMGEHLEDFGGLKVQHKTRYT